MKKILFSTFIILLAKTSLAAPHPGMGSSQLGQVSSNLVFSQMGFALPALNSSWNFDFATDADKTTATEDHSLQIDLTQTQGTRLSFLYDELKNKVNLETYVQKFLRDYNQYGFDISHIESSKDPQHPSITLELTQKSKKTRSLQIFFQNNKKIVTATCVDDFAHFEKSSLQCRKLLGTFTWK